MYLYNYLVSIFNKLSLNIRVIKHQVYNFSDVKLSNNLKKVDTKIKLLILKFLMLRKRL